MIEVNGPIEIAALVNFVEADLDATTIGAPGSRSLPQVGRTNVRATLKAANGE